MFMHIVLLDSRMIWSWEEISWTCKWWTFSCKVERLLRQTVLSSSENVC